MCSTLWNFLHVLLICFLCLYRCRRGCLLIQKRIICLKWQTISKLAQRFSIYGTDFHMKVIFNKMPLTILAAFPYGFSWHKQKLFWQALCCSVTLVHRLHHVIPSLVSVSLNSCFRLGQMSPREGSVQQADLNFLVRASAQEMLHLTREGVDQTARCAGWPESSLAALVILYVSIWSSLSQKRNYFKFI